MSQTQIETSVQSIVVDLYEGKRIERGDFGIVVTAGRGGKNVNKMVASLGRLSTGELLYCGDVKIAARKFAGQTNAAAKTTQIVSLPKTWAAIKSEFPGAANRGLREAIFDGCRRRGGAACSTIALTACGKASLEEVNRVSAEEYRELGFDKVIVGEGDPSIYGRGEVVAYMDQPISSL